MKALLILLLAIQALSGAPLFIVISAAALVPTFVSSACAAFAFVN